MGFVYTLIWASLTCHWNVTSCSYPRRHPRHQPQNHHNIPVPGYSCPQLADPNVTGLISLNGKKGRKIGVGERDRHGVSGWWRAGTGWLGELGRGGMGVVWLAGFSWSAAAWRSTRE
jgi:hypothetical protein